VALDLESPDVAVLLKLDPHLLLDGEWQRRLQPPPTRAPAGAEAGPVPPVRPLFTPLIEHHLILVAALLLARVCKFAPDELVDHEGVRELEANVGLGARVVDSLCACVCRHDWAHVQIERDERGVSAAYISYIYEPPRARQSRKLTNGCISEAGYMEL
jgi:hypothetical protein